MHYDNWGQSIISVFAILHGDARDGARVQCSVTNKKLEISILFTLCLRYIHYTLYLIIWFQLRFLKPHWCNVWLLTRRLWVRFAFWGMICFHLPFLVIKPKNPRGVVLRDFILNVWMIGRCVRNEISTLVSFFLTCYMQDMTWS